ncbi:hypothetical protein C8J57DRAFT_1225905 [Mycena rebaudengoi]|nr:hypothetical protein C8J57DRAFT_1225905 [Mycena rebaudengoi]
MVLFCFHHIPSVGLESSPSGGTEVYFFDLNQMTRHGLRGFFIGIIYDPGYVHAERRRMNIATHIRFSNNHHPCGAVGILNFRRRLGGRTILYAVAFSGGYRRSGAERAGELLCMGAPVDQKKGGKSLVRIERLSRPRATDYLSFCFNCNLQLKQKLKSNEYAILYTQCWPPASVPDDPLELEKTENVERCAAEQMMDQENGSRGDKGTLPVNLQANLVNIWRSKSEEVDDIST